MGPAGQRLAREHAMANASRLRRSLRLLCCEEFESRFFLSAVSFVAHDIVVHEAEGANTVFAADLDGDGDKDVLSASENDNKIAWYENLDGRGDFGPQKVISAKVYGAQSVHAADVDGDGDMDLLAASSDFQTHKIAWYKNTDGKGTFGPSQEITAWGRNTQGPRSVYATDLDGDGDLDVLAAFLDSYSRE